MRWLQQVIEFWIEWYLAWFRVAAELLEWPTALRNESRRRALELEESDNDEDT